jgi:hypothetical protein
MQYMQKLLTSDQLSKLTFHSRIETDTQTE